MQIQKYMQVYQALGPGPLPGKHKPKSNKRFFSSSTGKVSACTFDFQKQHCWDASNWIVKYIKYIHWGFCGVFFLSKMNNGHGSKQQLQPKGETYVNTPLKTAQWFSFAHYSAYTDVKQIHTGICIQVSQFKLTCKCAIVFPKAFLCLT